MAEGDAAVAVASIRPRPLSRGDLTALGLPADFLSSFNSATALEPWRRTLRCSPWRPWSMLQFGHGP